MKMVFKPQFLLPLFVLSIVGQPLRAQTQVSPETMASLTSTRLQAMLSAQVPNLPVALRADAVAKIAAHASDWCRPILSLPSKSYSAGFSAWITTSIEQEAGRNMGFMAPQNPSKENDDRTFARATKMFSQLTSAQADALLVKRQTALRNTQAFDAALYKFLVAQLTSEKVITVDFQDTDDDGGFIESIEPTLMTAPAQSPAVPNTTLDRISSQLVQSYVDSWIRFDVDISADLARNSVYNIFTAFYDPNDPRSKTVSRTFAQALPQIRRQLAVVVVRKAGQVTLKMASLNRFIWNSYQSQWVDKPLDAVSANPNQEHVPPLVITLDPAMTKTLVTSLDSFYAQRY